MFSDSVHDREIKLVFTIKNKIVAQRKIEGTNGYVKSEVETTIYTSNASSTFILHTKCKEKHSKLHNIPT